MGALGEVQGGGEQAAALGQLGLGVVQEVIHVVALGRGQGHLAAVHVAAVFLVRHGGQGYPGLPLALEAQFARLVIGQLHQVGGLKQPPLIHQDIDGVAVGQGILLVHLGEELLIESLGVVQGPDGLIGVRQAQQPLIQAVDLRGQLVGLGVGLDALGDVALVDLLLADLPQGPGGLLLADHGDDALLAFGAVRRGPHQDQVPLGQADGQHKQHHRRHQHQGRQHGEQQGAVHAPAADVADGLVVLAHPLPLGVLLFGVADAAMVFGPPGVLGIAGGAGRPFGADAVDRRRLMAAPLPDLRGGVRAAGGPQRRAAMGADAGAVVRAHAAAFTDHCT